MIDEALNLLPGKLPSRTFFQQDALLQPHLYTEIGHSVHMRFWQLAVSSKRARCARTLGKDD